MTVTQSATGSGLDLLEQVARYSQGYLAGLDDRPVRAEATLDQLRQRLAVELPDEPSDPDLVIARLIEAAEAGLVKIPGGRYFGFVIGGSVPAALAADWLTSAWDQNAGLYAAGPAAAVVEEVAGRWLLDLFGLPTRASFAFVTGGQMANMTALAAARHHVLAEHGWDVEKDGLAGSPPINVFVGAERHVTVDRALRFLGIGASALRVVDADEQGRMVPEALQRVLSAIDGPSIICAQAGNVNTGSFDPLAKVCEIGRDAGVWVHVDGAFGLWAAATPGLRHLVDGVAAADSWATDAHKWLNVPYDCGLAFVAHPEAHRAAMGVTASYLVHAGPNGPRDEVDWTPEFSRRARGVPVYAALRSLGRQGVAELVQRCCEHAQHFATRLSAEPGIEILNDVVLNQVLVRFLHPAGDHDGHTRRVIQRVQDDGTCWMGGTTWHGMAAMRISVSNWSTTSDDVARSVQAIVTAARQPS
jgi:glutamate/tyrosine decarboxylase-like PLP-dependent enzyme